MAIHYFYGEDTYAARVAILDLAKKEEAKLRWLDKNDVMEQGLTQVVIQGGVGLFGKELLVIKDPGEMASGTQEELASALRVTKKGQYVLWDRDEPKKSLRIYKAFGRQGKQFAVPDTGTLVNWLMEMAQKRQVQLDFRVARLLVDRAGLNRWRLISELEKLSLLRDVVTEDNVREAVPASVQAEIFSVLDVLARGDRIRTIEGVKALLDSGRSDFYILSMLAYQFKTLFALRSGIDRGKKQFDVVREAGMKQYTVQKNWEVAKRRPALFWRSALTRVLATDFAIKQGRVDARTGVLMLVAGLV